MKRLLFSVSIFLLLVFSSALVSRAQTLYTQPPNAAGGFYHSSRWDPDGSDWDQYVWDAFKLQQDSAITEIRWRGAFDPGYNGSGGAVRDFRIAIHASIAVQTEPDIVNPPLMVFRAGGNANQTSAGTAGGVNMYDYSVTLPRAFNATANVKYWVQIEALQWGVPDWSLARGTGGDGAHFRGIAGSTLYYQMISGDTCFTLVGSTVVRAQAPIDFDGDGKTDIAVFRPSLGEWWINQSGTSETVAAQFGSAADKPVAADYTGDGKSDIAFWDTATGEWFILRSENASFLSFPFGTTGDVPLVGDFDADGRADPTVFRPSTNEWFILKSTGGTTITTFGTTGDAPVAADFDGDARTDIAIYRPSNGQWWIQRSTNGSVYAFEFGNAADKPVPGDYTGDGKADAAFWRPSNGFWYILRSEDSSFYSVPFGMTGDMPAPGDYDGDGRFDTAVFRPAGATWYVNRSTAGILITSFGMNGDVPLPTVFVP
jgi:hypothetical protein